MVIDLKKCVGCNACTTSCKQEHGTPQGVTRAKVMRKEIGQYPHVKRVILPVLCNHCEEPPCVDVCPTGATSKDKVTGIVSIDKKVCIGCSACVTACPYTARYPVHTYEGYFGEELTPYEEIKYKNMPSGVTDKCDFCADRLKQGLEPACVQVCLSSARIFGKKEDLMELITRRNGFQLRQELGTDPNVYYLP